jgi:hypothetical protein
MDDDELVDLYQQGESMNKLSARYEMSRPRVREILVRHRVAIRSDVPIIPPGMADAYRAGQTIRAVAEAFGYTYSKTRRMLINAGVRIRPTGGNGLPPTTRKRTRVSKELEQQQPPKPVEPLPVRVHVQTTARPVRDSGSYPSSELLARVLELVRAL